MYLIDHQQKVIDSIICLTETGKTASLLSRFRPKIPIHVLTSNEQTYRKLALYFGVIPHIIEFPENGLQEPYEIVKEAGLLGIVEPEKNVLVVYGSIWKTPGLTNSLSLMTVPGRRD
ncbi:MAG: Pyruvate kinase [Candidatus Pacebacteria bacterium GW2011_GWF1_36_5]|nr:MAG: Pyruvate kinase [Candidatus Pacebacteria bacterium GW2011_GWF1_36_5]